MRKIKTSIGLVTAIFIVCLAGCKLEDTAKIPGDISRFDPIAALPEIQKYAGAGARLIRISSYYVKSDGTMDLRDESRPHTEYLFIKDMNHGKGGKKLNLIDIDIRNPHWVTVKEPGKKGTYKDMGMSKNVSEISYFNEKVSLPECSFKEIWAKALNRGVPGKALAVIKYSGKGYNFQTKDEKYAILFNSKCEVLSGRSGP